MISPEDQRRTETLKMMSRTDAMDESTVYCKCGASHTWRWPDDAFDAFLDKHAPHVG